MSALDSQSIVLRAVTYVLELEDDCYYVGITQNLNLRLAQHWAGFGAVWTQLHKPIRVLELIYPGSEELENEIAFQFICLYGIEKVRGGIFCKDKMPSWFYDDPDDSMDLQKEVQILEAEAEELQQKLFQVVAELDEFSK